MIFATFEDAVAYLLTLEPPQGTYPLATAGATLEGLAAIETALEVAMPPSMKAVYQALTLKRLNWDMAPLLYDPQTLRYVNMGAYIRWQFPPVKATGWWEVGAAQARYLMVDARTDEVWLQSYDGAERTVCADNLKTVIRWAVSIHHESIGSVYEPLSVSRAKAEAFLDALLPPDIPRTFWLNYALSHANYIEWSRQHIYPYMDFPEYKDIPPAESEPPPLNQPAPHRWDALGFHYLDSLKGEPHFVTRLMAEISLHAGMMVKLLPRLKSRPELQTAYVDASHYILRLHAPNRAYMGVVFHEERGYDIFFNDNLETKITVDDETVVETIVAQYVAMSERPPR